MIPLPLLDSHAPPVRVMALHALAYCQRLFYLEEVEEIRVADDRVYAGRELHASLAADEDGDAVQIECEILAQASVMREVLASAIAAPHHEPFPIKRQPRQMRVSEMGRHRFGISRPEMRSPDEETEQDTAGDSTEENVDAAHSFSQR